MSYYETAEQRQIREQRNRIERLTAELNGTSAQRDALRRERENVLRRVQRENERLSRQIRQQQQAADRKVSQMSAAVQRLDAQVKERERLQNNKIEAMQRQHRQQVQRLETEHQEAQQELQAEIGRNRREMRRSISLLREETDQKIREQKEEASRALAQVSSKLEGQINEVNRNVNTLAQQIAEREMGDRELAVYWAQEAARMVTQIRETFQPQLLDDRKIGLLDRKIRQAGDDVKGGQYQSAITAGREAFYGAMDMKEELALAALEWNYQYNSVRTRERQLLEALEEAEQRVYEIDTEEGTYQYNNGIDYWTFGQLTILRNQIATVRASLEHAEEMKQPQLQEAEEELHSLQEQLLLLENAAHINVAMSVNRYETASKIGAILDDNYEMMDADGEFFAREDREEYHALFQNPVTRDQVAVVITPIPDEGGVVTNHIELIVGNADNNPVTRDRIAQEVAEKLRSAGLEGCSFSACSGRYGDRTPQEVARVSDMTAVERGDEKVRATKPVGAVQTDAVTSRVRRTQKTPVTSAK